MTYSWIRTATIFAIVAMALVACGDKKETAIPAPITSDKPNITGTPDVGKVEQVDVKATGTGITLSGAVSDALKSAIMQVNGTTVNASTVNVNFASTTTAQLNVETSDGSDSAKATETVQGQAFAEAIVTNSNGIVSAFKVENVTAPKAAGGTYTVDISAKIAKFKAPADSGKIKIVVAPLKSMQQSFNIGGRLVPASEVLEPIRQKIIDSLSQSGRFTVLDRQFDDAIQNELGMITSNQTSQNDMAKLGQALSADIIWVGSVNSLSYDRHARQLQTSDRELVSFSGAWSITQRLINLATRQIMLSDTFNGDFPSVAPTTMGASIDEKSAMANVQAEVVKKAIDSIMLKTFPISIVSIDGDSVVLSQGEGSVVEGARYRVVKLGKEMKDPQTGQSLGNMESDCCEVVVSRVTPKVSYGQLGNIKVKLEGVDPGVLQVREQVVTKAPDPTPQAATAESPGKQKSIKTADSGGVPIAGKPIEKDW
jgi:curli biogenesis system outer membrane secretion channel CsgG